MKPKIPAIAVPLLMLLSLPASAERYECSTEKKFVCSLEQGCQSVQADTRLMIDLDAQIYTRCDQKRCDSYSSEISYSGVYIIATRPGTMLKLLSPMGVETFNELAEALSETERQASTPAKSTFIDVATSGTSAFTSMGTCRRVL